MYIPEFEMELKARNDLEWCQIKDERSSFLMSIVANW